MMCYRYIVATIGVAVVLAGCASTGSGPSGMATVAQPEPVEGRQQYCLPGTGGEVEQRVRIRLLEQVALAHPDTETVGGWNTATETDLEGEVTAVTGGEAPPAAAVQITQYGYGISAMTCASTAP